MTGLHWNWNGHTIEIVQVDPSLPICKVEESYIDVQTGEDKVSTSVWHIRDNGADDIYIVSKFTPGFKLYVHDAVNYADYDFSSDTESDDDYTPSATRGDYGPSNPWDAPGMSIKDFF